jgi:hypothetical protein
MGWFWQTPSPNSKAGPAQTPSNEIPPSSSTTTSSTPESDPVDREFAAFLAQLMSEAKPASQKSEPQSQPQPSQRSSSSSRSWLPGASSSSLSSSQQTPTTYRDPSSPSTALSERQYPTSLSCRDMFDYAYHCNGLGGQWVSVYRDGKMQSCSEQWDDFWFCMRTRSLPADVRAEQIRERWRAKEEARYYAPGKRSSDDIWESRTEPVQPDSEFKVPFDPPNRNDGPEFHRKEWENRRRMRLYIEEMSKKGVEVEVE